MGCAALQRRRVWRVCAVRGGCWLCRAAAAQQQQQAAAAATEALPRTEAVTAEIGRARPALFLACPLVLTIALCLVSSCGTVWLKLNDG
eukprot:g17987.t1